MKKTDWDSYYQKPYNTALLTRKITQSALIKYIEKYSTQLEKIEMCELGGANSCFYNALFSRFKPSKYTIIDNNKLGIKKFSDFHKKNSVANLIVDDVLDLKYKGQYDIVYSIGLIEHFDNKGLIVATKTHFDLLKNDGIVIISVPTPTFLYRIIRKLAEILNVWIFHDENPIAIKDAQSIFNEFGEIIDYKILWGLGLTQAMFVVKKKC